MEKMLLIVRESFALVRRHKFYFLLPLLIMLAVLSILAFQIGPGIVISFIYAGI